MYILFALLKYTRIALGLRLNTSEPRKALDIVLIFTAVLPPRELLTAGRLDPSLGARLGDAKEARSPSHASATARKTCAPS